MKYLLIGLTILACNTPPTPPGTMPDKQAAQTAIVQNDSIIPAKYDASGKIVQLVKTDAEWKKILSPLAYNVMRESGTERSFSGKYWNNHEAGTYVCSACKLPLFSSDTKFESGTGWPSFYQPLTKDCTTGKEDKTLGMDRTEVQCARCGGHLGHVFDDGPQPTGLRYCMNSVSLDFIKRK